MQNIWLSQKIRMRGLGIRQQIHPSLASYKDGSLHRGVLFYGPKYRKSSLGVLPEFCWRHLKLLIEQAVEISGIGIAAAVDDFLDWQVAVS